MQLFCVILWLHLKPLHWVYLSWVIVSVGCLPSLLYSFLPFLCPSGCKYINRSWILIFWHITYYSIWFSGVNKMAAHLCQVVAFCRLFCCPLLGSLHNQHCCPLAGQGRCSQFIFPVKLCIFYCRGQTPSLGQVRYTMKNVPLFSACKSVRWLKVKSSPSLALLLNNWWFLWTL